MIATGSYPFSARSPMSVSGTTRTPRAINSSYALSSSSMFFTVNATCSRESNSFTCSHACQALPA
jgi:hypothetical protein